MTSSYCVIDLETTGLNPRTDRIIEIGCMVVRDGVPGPVESILVNPERELHPVITEITGITQKDVDGGVSISYALGWLMGKCESVETLVPQLVGHNIVAFDWEFLRWEWQRRGIDQGKYFVCNIHDTGALYVANQLGISPFVDEKPEEFCHRVMARRPPRMKWNLMWSCLDTGVMVDDVVQHRAVGDVILCQRLYEALAPLVTPVERPQVQAVRW